MAAGASDIPATRLLGKSPDGMNATGAGDQTNYDQMIKDIQESDLRPALGMLDHALIPSALGTTPPEVYYEFAPLSVKSKGDFDWLGAGIYFWENDPKRARETALPMRNNEPITRISLW